ncbi:MAG: hypothetical protein RL223_1159 [Pseudomonadota bacterium]|jgi:putative ABC transport system ATP-binding protein
MFHPAMGTPEPVAVLTGVHKHYQMDQVDVPVLRGLDVLIRPGLFTVILGPSGSGKTTMLNLLGGLDKPDRGEITVAGQRLNDLPDDELADFRSANIGFVFQNFNLLPVLSAYENIEYPLVIAGVPPAKRHNRVTKLLAAVGLSDRAKNKPGELSGGQRQRVAIARALVRRPKLVIADEPTANLDSRTGKAILTLMRRMQTRYGISFVFSSHDRELIHAADDLITLTDGVIRSVRRWQKPELPPAIVHPEGYEHDADDPMRGPDAASLAAARAAATGQIAVPVRHPGLASAAVATPVSLPVPAPASPGPAAAPVTPVGPSATDPVTPAAAVPAHDPAPASDTSPPPATDDDLLRLDPDPAEATSGWARGDDLPPLLPERRPAPPSATTAAEGATAAPWAGPLGQPAGQPWHAAPSRWHRNDPASTDEAPAADGPTGALMPDDDGLDVIELPPEFYVEFEATHVPPSPGEDTVFNELLALPELTAEDFDSPPVPPPVKRPRPYGMR